VYSFGRAVLLLLVEV